MAYKMTAARKAALRKAQLASARARRRGGKVAKGGRKIVRAQAKYSKRKKIAQSKRLVRNVKNEAKFYKNVAIRGAEKVTGAKSRKSPKKGIAKRFVKGVKANQAAYKKSTRYAKRVRKNEVRVAIRGR